MTEQFVESLNFDNLDVPIRREPTNEPYVALQPPDALPYIVAPPDMKPDDIVAFVQHWLELIRELRIDMIKRYEKSPSLKCHYRTGDVAYLFGRPFMLRVYPLSSSRKQKRSMRGRANVKATMRPEVSVIDLYLLNVGDYDQGRFAFLSFAKPIFQHNLKGLIEQSRTRVFSDVPLPTHIKSRPMRDAWIHIDAGGDTVWFSESLIPYPADCVIYAYLQEMILVHLPDATEEEAKDILDRGAPGWSQIKALLADEDSPFTRQ